MLSNLFTATQFSCSNSCSKVDVWSETRLVRDRQDYIHQRIGGCTYIHPHHGQVQVVEVTGELLPVVSMNVNKHCATCPGKILFNVVTCVLSSSTPLLILHTVYMFVHVHVCTCTCMTQSTRGLEVAPIPTLITAKSRWWRSLECYREILLSTMPEG